MTSHGRLVEYVRGRIQVSPRQVAVEWRVVCPAFVVGANAIVIPPQYAVGTAQHESDFTLDEIDTEPSGFRSMGLYQLSFDEAREAGRTDADMLSLSDATVVMSRVAATRARALMAAAEVQELSPDLVAMLSVAHNQGLGAALTSIRSHGLNWKAYCERNLDAAQKKLDEAKASEEAEAIKAAESHLAWWRDVVSYGNDCITGGERWSEAEAS